MNKLNKRKVSPWMMRVPLQWMIYRSTAAPLKLLVTYLGRAVPPKNVFDSRASLDVLTQGLNTVPNKPIKYETIHIVHSNYIVLFAYIHRSIHPPIHIGNICICVSHILNLLIESWCFLEMSGVGGGQMGSRSRTVGMPPGPFWRSLNAYNLLVRST